MRVMNCKRQLEYTAYRVELLVVSFACALRCQCVAAQEHRYGLELKHHLSFVLTGLAWLERPGLEGEFQGQLDIEGLAVADTRCVGAVAGVRDETEGASG